MYALTHVLNHHSVLFVRYLKVVALVVVEFGRPCVLHIVVMI